MQNAKCKTQNDDASKRRLVVDAITRLTNQRAGIRLDLSPVAALNIVAQLQLALRHPSNKGASATATREIVEHLIRHVEAFDPVLSLLRLGDDPSHDVECGGPNEC